MALKDEIRSALEAAVRDLALEWGAETVSLPEVKVEYPREEKFGEYATPVALELAKAFRKPPFDIAMAVAGRLENNKLFSTVEAVRPGFINFTISYTSLEHVLRDTVDSRTTYGRRTKNNPKRVNIEFVSANPTGPLNIVSARAAAIGDTLARIMEAAGDSVDREYYINDYGNQVRLLGLSVYTRYLQQQGQDIPFPEDGYQGDYVADLARDIAAADAAGIASCGDDREALIDWFSRKAVATIVKGQQQVMARFNVEYQRWFSERTLHESGAVPAVGEELDKHGALYTEDGKKVFRATDYGDEKDRVVVREDGRPTYLLADIAYHEDKFTRGYDRLIDIWGPDHHGYIARLRGALQALGHPAENFQVLIAQQVNLLSNGELVKMSKRLGRFSTMEDLVEEIGVDVARFFFAMRSLESHLDFDLDLAKRQSSENPVFYLQYAHARICSVFREAEKRGIVCDAKQLDMTHLEHAAARAVMVLVARFPEEIADAAEACEPHRLTTFLMKIAQSYHKFYTEHRIVTDNVAMTNTYLVLCDAVRIVIANGLGLLGVSAPERM